MNFKLQIRFKGWWQCKVSRGDGRGWAIINSNLILCIETWNKIEIFSRSFDSLHVYISYQWYKYFIFVCHMLRLLREHQLCNYLNPRCGSCCDLWSSSLKCRRRQLITYTLLPWFQTALNAQPRKQYYENLKRIIDIEKTKIWVSYCFTMVKRLYYLFRFRFMKHIFL